MLQDPLAAQDQGGDAQRHVQVCVLLPPSLLARPPRPFAWVSRLADITPYATDAGSKKNGHGTANWGSENEVRRRPALVLKFPFHAPDSRSPRPVQDILEGIFLSSRRSSASGTHPDPRTRRHRPRPLERLRLALARRDGCSQGASHVLCAQGDESDPCSCDTAVDVAADVALARDGRRQGAQAHRRFVCRLSLSQLAREPQRPFVQPLLTPRMQ